MKTAGRNGTYGRIRPAVGDQRGGLTESSTKENDSDWIKIQQYVTTLNPRILGEAQDALNRKKWKGEGVAQQAFETSCVSDMAALSVMCSSEDVVASVAHALSAMADSGLQPVEDGKTHLIIEGLAIRVEQMPGWVQGLRRFRSGPDVARLQGLEFSSASADAAATASALQERSIDAETASDGSSLTISSFKAEGLSDRLRLGLSKMVDVLPAAISVSHAAAKPTSTAQTTRVKEVVLGASWEEHAAFERDLDRLLGSKSRVALGVWQPPNGPLLRLVPTDSSGLKTLVLYSPDLEAAQQRLRAAGLTSHQFPGYWSVKVGGLDLRLTEKEDPDSHYEEVRWEVDESEALSSGAGARNNVSCVGAITHGIAKSAASGTLGKRMRG